MLWSAFLGLLFFLLIDECRCWHCCQCLSLKEGQTKLSELYNSLLWPNYHFNFGFLELQRPEAGVFWEAASGSLYLKRCAQKGRFSLLQISYLLEWFSFNNLKANKKHTSRLILCRNQLYYMIIRMWTPLSNSLVVWTRYLSFSSNKS